METKEFDVEVISRYEDTRLSEQSPGDHGVIKIPETDSDVLSDENGTQPADQSPDDHGEIRIDFEDERDPVAPSQEE